jgi:hypothetical protein
MNDSIIESLRETDFCRAAAAAIVSPFLRQRPFGLKLVLNCGEDGNQLVADTVDRRNNGDRDAGSDQPVVDRGGTGLVFQEELVQQVDGSFKIDQGPIRNMMVNKSSS